MVAGLEMDKASLQQELAEVYASIRAIDGDRGAATHIELPNGSLVTATVQLFSCGSCGFSFDAIHCDDEQVDVADRTWTCPCCFPDALLPLSPEANSDA